MNAAKILSPFGPLIAALGVLILWPVLHVMAAVPASEAELLVLSYVPGMFVMLWAVGDAQRRRCTPFFDFGLLMWILFPLSLLGYLVWTRGWWGCVACLGLIGAIYGPWILADALAILAAG